MEKTRTQIEHELTMERATTKALRARIEGLQMKIHDLTTKQGQGDDPDLSDRVSELERLVVRMMNAHEATEARLTALIDTVYQIAPEKEIIDTLADSEEERQEMTERYMNHGNFYEALTGPEPENITGNAIY